MAIHSRYRAGLWLPDEKPMYGAQPILGHPLTPTAAWIMNEGGGNTVFDCINGNHGTLASGVTWINNGVLCDADAERITFSGISFGTTHSIVIATPEWKYGGAGVYRTMLAKDAGTDTAMGTHANKLNYYYSVTQHYANTTLIDGNPYQFGISVNAGAGTFYINGKPDGSCASVPSGTWHQLGNDPWNNEADFVLSYAYIYDRALTSSEFVQLYSNPYCWLAHPMGAELMYAPPAAGAVMNQFQRSNIGADLYDGVLIT